MSSAAEGGEAGDVGEAAKKVRFIGRYALYDALASGGMATVYLGRLLGPVGFSRTVAIKRLHPQFAADPEFVSMFLDEARLAARIRHPNVVQTLDVVATKGELFLVMDYVHGGSLSHLIRADRMMPLPIVIAVMSGTLQGLHAAHEAKSERGEPLSIVHRDVSPQNILVGSDGGTRVLDFGVAKAVGRLQSTREGQLKGKLAYMAPEQLLNESVGRPLDIYAASVVLWEVIAGERLFQAASDGGLVNKILTATVDPAGARRAASADDDVKEQLRRIDEVIFRGLAKKPQDRFPTALQMALALEAIVTPASSAQVAAWVQKVAGELLTKQAGLVAVIEGESSTGPNQEVGAGEGGTDRESGSSGSARQPGPTSHPSLMDALGSASDQVETRGQFAPPAEIPVDSSVSSIMAEPFERPRPRMVGRIWGAAAAVVLLIGVAVVSTNATRAPASAPTSRAAASEQPAAPSPSVAATPAPASTPAEPSPASGPETAPVPATPTVAVGEAPKAVPRAPARPLGAHAAPVAPVAPAAHPAAAPKSDCEPPYTYDANGHKHYKPECPL
jgi:serine/threonine-protein kinase